MSEDMYRSRGGIEVRRSVEDVPIADAIEPVVDRLDAERGVLLTSSYEYPGRYTRWDMGFVSPPIVLTARGHAFRVTALNRRGEVLLPAVQDALRGLPAVASVALD